jgi:hypothetical protein
MILNLDILKFTSMIENISLEKYHKELTNYVGSSTLKQILVSPKWMKYCILNPEDSRISLESELKGSVYHSILASITNKGDKSDFEAEYTVFAPPINEKTGKPFGYETGKFLDAYNGFQAENPGKTICSQTEVDLANIMIEQLLTGNSHLSKDVNYLISHGKAEQSHLVEYQGKNFKFRPDLETNKKIVDWKTCGFEVPKVENFARQIVKFGYHISAAFYQYFDFIETGVWRSFYWIAQEKEPPFDFNIIDASNWSFEIHSIEHKESLVIPESSNQFVIETPSQIAIPNTGAIIFLQLLTEYIHCAELDKWPGYSVFTQPDWRNRRIGKSEVPNWEKIKNINFYN